MFQAGLAGWVSGGVLVALLVAARMSQAVIMAATPPSAAAYTADITAPEARTRGMGRIGAANNLGTVLGPGIGGMLAAVALVLPLYLQAFAANIVSAGVRLIPLGQTDGQLAQAALEPTVTETAATAPALDDLWTASPLLDIRSMAHETQYTRIFRS